MHFAGHGAQMGSEIEGHGVILYFSFDLYKLELK